MEHKARVENEVEDISCLNSKMDLGLEAEAEEETTGLLILSEVEAGEDTFGIVKSKICEAREETSFVKSKIFFEEEASFEKSKIFEAGEEALGTVKSKIAQSHAKLAVFPKFNISGNL